MKKERIKSGNKKWHSTETSLVSSTDAILRAIDQTKVTAVVYLDMSKAFDCIKHEILLNKLKNSRRHKVPPSHSLTLLSVQNLNQMPPG